jgi:flagellar protein FlaH
MAGTAPEEKPKDRGLYPIFIKSDELHAKLGGGLPKGAVMIIEGMEGSGRSVISQRLCYGLLANGASVTFVSTEMTIKDFIDQMYSIEYKVGPYLLSQKLLYLPVYPLLGQTMVRDDFLEKLITSPQLYERDVLIVDSFSSLINRKLDNNQAQSLMGFLKKVARSNKTVILTAESGIASLEPVRLSADIFLNLEIRNKGGISREIQVKRFLRARGQVEEQMRYRIESRSGMVIEITDVSG